MTQKNDTTEGKILEAAKSVFIRKGMEGARMQEIADEAGFNKALVHYYYRTKEKLFEAIFYEVAKFAFPELSKILLSDIDIEKRIDMFIDAYIQIPLKHPYIPMFILKELNRDASGLLKLVSKLGLNPDPVMVAIQKEMDNGRLVKMDPHHLAANVVAMCIFPFAVRPLVQHVIFKGEKEPLEKFYAERAEVIKKFVKDAVVIKQI